MFAANVESQSATSDSDLEQGIDDDLPVDAYDSPKKKRSRL